MTKRKPRKLGTCGGNLTAIRVDTADLKDGDVLFYEDCLMTCGEFKTCNSDWGPELAGDGTDIRWTDAIIIAYNRVVPKSWMTPPDDETRTWRVIGNDTDTFWRIISDGMGTEEGAV